MGGLIGVLIRASFKSDAIFSLVFETILIQLIDRAPRTIFDTTAGRHRGSDSRRSVFNRFGPPVIINVVNFQNLTAHFARKLLF